MRDLSLALSDDGIVALAKKWASSHYTCEWLPHEDGTISVTLSQPAILGFARELLELAVKRASDA